jgi:hypothetical protein
VTAVKTDQENLIQISDIGNRIMAAITTSDLGIHILQAGKGYSMT